MSAKTTQGSSHGQHIAHSEPQTVTITMPHPPASLSPNGRSHWRTKAADAKRLREYGAYLTRNAIWADGIDSHPWPACRMDIRWLFAGTQPDADNCIARLKSAIDGIADACLVANDNVIEIGAVTMERVPRAEQGVILTLTRMEAT